MYAIGASAIDRCAVGSSIEHWLIDRRSSTSLCRRCWFESLSFVIIVVFQIVSLKGDDVDSIAMSLCCDVRLLIRKQVRVLTYYSSLLLFRNRCV